MSDSGPIDPDVYVQGVCNDSQCMTLAHDATVLLFWIPFPKTERRRLCFFCVPQFQVSFAGSSASHALTEGSPSDRSIQQEVD
jgi:hypothetical protein